MYIFVYRLKSRYKIKKYDYFKSHLLNLLFFNRITHSIIIYKKQNHFIKKKN